MANPNLNFECPPEYKEENVSSELYYEDLDNDSELWLIRVPSNIELTDIDRKKIVLSNQSNILSVKTENGNMLDCYAEKGEIPHLNLILPRKSDGSLKRTKQAFQGSIYISEELSLKDENEVEIHETYMNEDKSVSESRNSVFRSSEKKSKKKRRKSISYDEDLHYETDDASHLISENSQPSHSGKKKDANMKRQNLLTLGLDEFPNCKSQV